MRWGRFSVFLLVLALLQAGLADSIAVSRLNIKPDFLLIYMIFLALYCNTSEVIISSFLIGFVADLISPPVMGANMITFGVLGTLLAYLHRVIAVRKVSYQFLIIFCTGFAAGMITSFLRFMVHQPIAQNLFIILLGTSVYSAIIGPIMFGPLSWLMHIKTTQYSRY